MLKIAIENAGPCQINFCRSHLTSTLLLCNKVKKYWGFPRCFNIQNVVIVQNLICVSASKYLKHISQEISSELKSEHFNITAWRLKQESATAEFDHQPCHNRIVLKCKKQCLLSKEMKDIALKLSRLHSLDSMYNRIQCIYLLQRVCLNTP